ncbi:hypothetical protein RIF29_35167 [Crotalaria pallida]|uniref:RNase H type-1 domain-containing protein n=1 Tax=Crotalaria pallida TaxID=3830 RepID=A0AAN9HXT4_CROPI
MVNEGVPDCITWKGDLNVVYTARSGYAWLLNNNMLDLHTDSWSWIWKLKVPQKLNFFLWLVCHSAIPTNVLRFQRHCAGSDICSRCGIASETVLHCLRDCNKARVIWLKLDLEDKKWFWEDVNVTHWIQNGVRALDRVFVTMAWWIWRARCSKSIVNQSMTTAEVLHSASLMHDNIQHCFGGTLGNGNQVKWVSWTPPLTDNVVLNVDGSALGNLGLAGYGGLIRDRDGK